MDIKDNESIGLKAIIIKYLLHWKLFVGVFILTFIPAILYLVLYPRTYEMYSSIQIQEDKEMSGGSFGLGEASGLMKSMGLGSMSVGAVSIEDEMVTLSSMAILKKVVSDLGLQAEYRQPYSFHKLYENIPFVLKADKETDERLQEEVEFKVSVNKGKVRVKTKARSTGKSKFEFASLPATITLPQGVFTLDYTNGKENLPYNKVNITYRPALWVAEELADEVYIEDFSKTSSVIELSYQDHELKRGVNLLNSLIDNYNKTSLSYKKSEGIKMVDFLDLRIDSITGALLDIEKDIAVYKTAHKLTDIEHDVLLYTEQMKELQIRLIELEAQSHVIKMMDDFVKDPANKYNLVPSLITQESEKGPISTYNEVLVERARVIQNSNISNPLVATLTEQADQLRSSVFLSISNAQAGVQLAIANIKQKEKEIYAKMGSFPEQEKSYRDLVRQQEIYQGIYLILLQKREETALNAGVDRDKAKVVDPPFVRSTPVGPRKLFALIGMMIFTILIPVIYLFCKEQYQSLKQSYKDAKTK